MLAAVWRNASISACAVGSFSRIGELNPRPQTWPSTTTTAPTGTSPCASARLANSSASRMNNSSLDIVLVEWYRAYVPLFPVHPQEYSEESPAQHPHHQ